jgi:flagellar biosynthetic protein FlhB
MAEDSDAEKTQDPTAKRLTDAHERGDVVKSQEVNTWFLMGGATLVLSTFGSSIGTGLQVPLRSLIEKSWMIRVDGPNMIQLAKSFGTSILSAIGIPFLFLIIAAVAGNLVQHRFVWSTEGLTPSFKKISPAAGFKRVFGKQALANTLKSIFKMIALGVVICAVMWPERFRVDAMLRTDPTALLGITVSLTLKIMSAVVAMLTAVAIGDYLFQYRSWYERQKMTLEEVKEEYKQSEGDPHIKGRIRQMRVARMRKRMMAAVPKASVIITNPTHYAVALSYERGMTAPICVAKGVDAVALKIREVAGEHDIPIVENVPLARALYATTEIDEQIPAEHYHAVAEVIGYVMKLKRGLSGRRT